MTGSFTCVVIFLARSYFSEILVRMRSFPRTSFNFKTQRRRTARCRAGKEQLKRVESLLPQNKAQIKTRTWPRLSSLCRIRSTAAPERLVIYCQTTGFSAAHATHCATYCTPCRPLTRAFSGWIRTPPPTTAAPRLSSKK